MAKLTLLQMVTQACGEMGVPAPQTMSSASDLSAIQLLALANREGRECARSANSAGGWQELRKEYTFNVQSTGIIPLCSYTKGSNVITIGTPPTQAPQVGWVICTSGGSNSTGFPNNTVITNVSGSSITVSNSATVTNSSTSMAFGQQSYSLPSDYDFMISGTQWDRGYRWQVFGPLTPQEWQVLKSGLSPTGPRRRFRLMGGMYYLDPVPYDSNLLVYEYLSNDFVNSIGNTATTANVFTSDSDTYVLPDDLMILGLKFRYRKAKGLEYGDDEDAYQRALQRELGRDTGSRVLRLDISTPDVALLSANQIPDTGFGMS